MRSPRPWTGHLDKALRLAVFLAAALVVAGCCGKNLGPGLSTGFDFAAVAPNENATLLSTPLLVIADTHAHHLTGEPLFVTTNLADKLERSAIRPPQSDLYGPASLAWMLDQTQLKTPLVHLGDAADASCKDEFEAFLRVMRRRPKLPRWFMAPGNHDGFFYGNSSEDPNGDAWTRACGDGSSPMTKADFVTAYLDALATEDDPGARALAAARSSAAATTGEIAANDPGAMLIGAAWRIDRAAPWRSYVVQRLDLTRRARPEDSGPSVPQARVIGLLLDTSTFDLKPSIVAIPPVMNVGITGSLGPDEGSARPDFVPARAILRRWADEAKREGATLILFGHHDFESLEPAAQRFLHALHREDGATLYVSAHRHDGHWSSIGSPDDAWPELNLGSMLDEPIEMRELSLRWTDSGRLSVVAPLLRLNNPNLLPPECGTMQKEWEPAPNEEDYPLSYKLTGFYAPDATRSKILRVMLASYRRLFTKLAFSAGPGWPAGLPSDPPALAALVTATIAAPDDAPKVALLHELGAADEAAVFASPEIAGAFRVCQVYWGSKYETRGVRLPDTSDWTILFPKAKDASPR